MNWLKNIRDAFGIKAPKKDDRTFGTRILDALDPSRLQERNRRVAAEKVGQTLPNLSFGQRLNEAAFPKERTKRLKAEADERRVLRSRILAEEMYKRQAKDAEWRQERLNNKAQSRIFKEMEDYRKREEDNSRFQQKFENKTSKAVDKMVRDLEKENKAAERREAGVDGAMDRLLKQTKKDNRKFEKEMKAKQDEEQLSRREQERETYQEKKQFTPEETALPIIVWDDDDNIEAGRVQATNFGVPGSPQLLKRYWAIRKEREKKGIFHDTPELKQMKADGIREMNLWKEDNGFY